jgi:hypothetical protein
MTQTLVAGRITSLSAHAPIDVPRALVILGSSAVGAYIGFRLGGPQGAAVGALVAATVASIAVLVVRRVRVRVNAKGEIIVEVEWAV